MRFVNLILGTRRCGGVTHEEILDDHPLLEAGDIIAVLQFAARQSDHPALRVA
jgi:uncharacterized protein (DUF433 family)